MHFDIEQVKSNKTLLFVMLISTTLLILFNGLISNIQPSESKLDDNDIEIHKLVINEVMTSNKGIFIDPTGNTYDWIELYNGSKKDIDLYNYGLSDKEDGSIKWLFPKAIIPSNSYLIIYLSGEKMDGLYANFSLKQEGGEIITLKNPHGKVVDSVKTLEVKKNNTMSRDSKGNWIITEDITPGFQNNEEGRSEYLSGSKALQEPSPLVLTEFLPSNEGNIIFNNDKLYGYIEVTNEGESPISLSEYYLSNDLKTVYKWRLPNKILQPNESYLVFTNELNKDNNANFKLKHHQGTVVLSNKFGIIEEVEYEELTNGMAYLKVDNRWRIGGNISPGYPNTSAGKIKFQSNYDIPKKDLIINEIMSSNHKYLPQNGNQFYDWVEVYNNTNETINLSKYYLTTDYDDPQMYQLPNVNLGPYQYYVIMASGDTSLSNGNYKHANFKLSSGKGLLLYKEEQLIDSLFIYSIPRGNSYGRGSSNGHFYYGTPTPKARNENNGIREVSFNPTFNQEGGVFNGVSSLEIKIDGSGTIYYTTDGSVPTAKSTKYTGPFRISKTTVIRAVAYERSKKNSDVITNSYIINANHKLPVMSVSLPEARFRSIQASTYGKSTAAAHAELFEENSSFSRDCGFKLFGGQSRELPKKSFALKFNSGYSGHLHYKVFDDKDLVEFNTLVLRGGSQDQGTTMMKDEFNSLMQIKYGTVDAQAVKPIVLYINGKYWGVYYIREKIDDDFIQNNYNVQAKTNIVNYKFAREEGSNAKIINLKKYILSHDMTDETNYNYVKTQINVENFADYWVTHTILGSSDLHNIRYYNNSKIDGGKIRLILYDTDYTYLANYGAYYINFIKDPSVLMAPPDSTILKGLFNNAEFKKLFIKRVAYYINNVWTEEHINEVYNYLYNSIEPEMNRNCARWGIDYNGWKSRTTALKKKIISRRGLTKTAIKVYFHLGEEEFNGYFS